MQNKAKIGVILDGLREFLTQLCAKNMVFRRLIPKRHRRNDEVFIVDTKDGLLITNHKYKVVEVENENSAQ